MFLGQVSTDDVQADGCAARYYHEVCQQHNVTSELHLIPLHQQRTFCVGTPGEPGLPAEDRYARYANSSYALNCMNHTLGSWGMVEPLTKFLVKELAGTPDLVAATAAPFAHDYRVVMELGKPGEPKQAVPFSCTSAADGSAAISCSGVSCSNGCIAINTSYEAVTPPPSCHWKPDGLCKALPALRSSNCNAQDDSGGGGGSAFFTSVSAPLTAELVEKLMNDCTNAVSRRTLKTTDEERPGLEIFVDPAAGSDDVLLEAGGGTRVMPLRTVHAARTAVRSLLRRHPGADVTVQLLPGEHTVGDAPLRLGPEDGGAGAGWVTWRSADPSTPAVIGAPIHVTGWKPHPTVKGAFSAPLPSNISKGSLLRHLWVDDKRAQRPRGIPSDQGPRGPKMSTFNLSMGVNTSLYPEGSKYDFAGTGIDPSQWPNPEDVEFVFTSCSSFNCWVEPRCGVGAVDGSMVSLKQETNASCFWRLYYFGIGWGGSPLGGGLRHKYPTALENLGTNWTQPGEFYYDRAAASIGYIPRAGETVATLEATAITATAQEVLVVNGSQNLRFDGVSFRYATWLGASGQQGFVDTQSAFLYEVKSFS